MYTHTHTHTPHTNTVTGSSPSTLIRQEGLYVEEELTNRPHQYCIVWACLDHWPQRHGERGGGGEEKEERDKLERGQDMEGREKWICRNEDDFTPVPYGCDPHTHTHMTHVIWDPIHTLQYRKWWEATWSELCFHIFEHIHQLHLHEVFTHACSQLI